VYTGSSATLTVGAVGVPDLCYQWRRNRAPIPGAAHSFLTLTNLQLGDTASYSVVLSNALGATVSAEAVLSVIEGLPVIFVPPVSPSGLRGRSGGVLRGGGGFSPACLSMAPSRK